MHHDTPAPRPEIALSWRRSRLSGLTPSGRPEIRVDTDAVDRGGRLARAAGPVLGDLAERLGDAAYCVVLADRDSRIVAPTVGARGLRARLEGLGVVSGGVFREETTGTNSIATVYEVRRGFAVHGEEHYLEPFKRFSCYGHPIVHPVSRRLEGVLDITCLRRDDSPLLAPLLARAAQDVEERLLDGARAAERRMLAAFQTATAGRRRPVLVLGEGVVLANPAAVELLDPVDHVRLRELAGSLGGDRREGRAVPVGLVSGQTMSVRLTAVEAGAEGVLFEFDGPAGSGAEGGPGGRRARAPRAGFARGALVYVGGPPGSGRTTRAGELAVGAGGPLIALEAADAATRGAAGWLADLEAGAAEAAAADGVLLVEEVPLLPDVCAVRLRRLLERPDGPRVVLTGPPAGELSGYGAALAADCPQRCALPALRDRTEDLPGLVREMLAQEGAREGVRFTPAALGALAGHSWPGNLRELRTVVRAALQVRSAGDVTPADLPEGYRVSPGLRRMTPLESAEHDAITAALRACDGNKVHTARRLGISRTTLYSRMRALRITG